jgi:hypothetical protein
MSENELVKVELDDFTGSASHDGTLITTRLAGNADHAAIEAMADLLGTIHTKAVELGVGEVVIDLRALELAVAPVQASLRLESRHALAEAQPADARVLRDRAHRRRVAPESRPIDLRSGRDVSSSGG